MILHDHRDLIDHRDEYLRAARELNSRLSKIHAAPLLFVEYAVGLEPEAFAAFFSAIRELEQISACIDIGHVGIRQVRKTYALAHPDEDICALKSASIDLPSRMPDIARAVPAALPAVLALTESIAALGKPLHLHLHDGHPLAPVSPYGISDHLSFLAQIPLPFEFRGRRSVPLMFGPEGLFQIVHRTLQAMGDAPVSFTLEIHPTDGRLALSDAARLFGHWQDKTNAEKMNHWLATLAESHALLLQAIDGRLILVDGE
jgi:hypothetical protein